MVPVVKKKKIRLQTQKTQEMCIQSLGPEDPLGVGSGNPSNILA